MFFEQLVGFFAIKFYNNFNIGYPLSLNLYSFTWSGQTKLVLSNHRRVIRCPFNISFTTQVVK